MKYLGWQHMSKVMKTDEQALMPRLRFPEFQNEPAFQWRELGELIYEKRSRNRELRYGKEDVLSVSGDYGCVNQIELLGRSYAGVSVKDYHIVETGDVVYTKSPLKKSPYGIIKENKGKPGIVSTLYAVYSPTAICHAAYLDHYFSVEYNINSYLQPLVNKGAKNDMKVKNSDVIKGGIFVPGLKEQKKIADFLSSIDTLIAAQVEKIDALKIYKKWLMQKLFPGEGETVPQLRFPEFRDSEEWKIKALGDVCNILQGYGFPNEMQGRYDGEYPFCKVSDVSKAVAVNGGLLNEAANYVDSEDVLNLRAKLIPVGSTVFAKIGEALRLNRRAYVNRECLIDNNVVGLKANDDTSNDYFIYLSSQLIDLNKHCGGAVPSVKKSTLETVEIALPDPFEQQKIAEFLSSLDGAIAAHTEKLEALKVHKKGLMQKIFPQP